MFVQRFSEGFGQKGGVLLDEAKRRFQRGRGGRDFIRCFFRSVLHDRRFRDNGLFSSAGSGAAGASCAADAVLCVSVDAVSCVDAGAAASSPQAVRVNTSPHSRQTVNKMAMLLFTVLFSSS